MQLRNADAGEYRFLTWHGANVECRLASLPGGSELQIFGNRLGLLSLANVFLWFVANAWRRELLSLRELSFVHLAAQLSVCIRLADAASAHSHGTIRRQDRGNLLEWEISEEKLQEVALWMHRLVSDPAHEYDQLLMAPTSEHQVQVRMTDAAEWLGIATV